MSKLSAKDCSCVSSRDVGESERGRQQNIKEVEGIGTGGDEKLHDIYVRRLEVITTDIEKLLLLLEIKEVEEESQTFHQVNVERKACDRRGSRQTSERFLHYTI